MQAQSDKHIPRPARIISHSIAEVRNFRYLPFGVQSAVLLDLSQSGFKLEYTAEVDITAGSQYWLRIPLAPYGIYSPKKIDVRVEIKWFDKNSMRSGGVFLNLKQKDQRLIKQIFDSLAKRRRR